MRCRQAPSRDSAGATAQGRHCGSTQDHLAAPGLSKGIDHHALSRSRAGIIAGDSPAGWPGTAVSAGGRLEPRRNSSPLDSWSPAAPDAAHGLDHGQDGGEDQRGHRQAGGKKSVAPRSTGLDYSSQRPGKQASPGRPCGRQRQPIAAPTSCASVVAEVDGHGVVGELDRPGRQKQPQYHRDRRLTITQLDDGRRD
jgi:hypothetical protein